MYDSTSGSSAWLKHDNWGTYKALSTWSGVTVDSDGRVTQLDLSDNRLLGRLPAALGRLDRLTRLDLSDNQITGRLPGALSALSALTRLDLSGNRITGAIPGALGSLGSLNRLDLSDNRITGRLPGALSALSALTRLDLSGNRITGKIPDAFGKLDKLNELALSDNQLTGAIPVKLADITGLSALDLSGNCLDGSPPAELGTLIHLTSLYLHDNCLSGKVPTQLTNQSQHSTLRVDIDNPALCRDPVLSLAHWNILSVCPNPATAPDPPNAVLTPNRAGTAIHLDWDIPASNGATITDYDIQYREINTTTWTGLTHTGTKTENTITGLTLSAVYQIQTRATNNIGTSDWSPITIQHTTPNDRAALMTLYNNTHGADHWTTTTNWGTYKPLNFWHGVTTDHNNRVTQLDLSGNHLTGPIPPEIGNLTHLTQLDLSDNHLTGTIPAALGNLTGLTQLHLHDNQLTGTIPKQLGNLGNLTTLHLHDNKLTGTIPAALGNLTSLTTLDLHDNQLTGAIPAALGNLTGLTTLDLHDNQLTGSIPAALGNLTGLTQLDLHDNQLTGSVPAALGNLTGLTTLDLSGNCLTGVPHLRLGGLLYLTNLYLQDTCLSGKVPIQITNTIQHSNLKIDTTGLCRDATLSLGTWTTLPTCPNPATAPDPPNAVLTPNRAGTAIHLDWDIPASNGATITDYDIQYREINTTTWTGLTHTGTKTENTITGLTLSAVYQIQTRATNNIGTSDWSPITIQHTTPNDRAALMTLYNNTHGADHWTTTTNWGTYKPLNFWSGVTTDHNNRVTQLDLSGNHLTGPIPPEIGNLTGLTQLDLSDNHLTGTIPKQLGNLTGLTTLDLNDNQLTGTIPAAIGKLGNLTTLDLNDNQLTGTIPAALGNLTSLTTLDLRDNQLTGLPTTFSTGNFTNLTTLHLNNNQLTGSIPPAIGNLTRLTNLYLNDNQLTGNLPPELKKLANLVNLHLQNNGLTGKAPTDLTALNKLSTLKIDTPGLCRPPTLNTTPWNAALNPCPSTTTKPATPAKPTLTHTGANLRIDWTPPASNGATITDYDIQYRTTTTGNWTNHPHSSAATTNTIPTTPNTTYQTQIRATNNIDTSDWSPTATHTTPNNDKTALIALHNNTEGPNWKTDCQKNWNTDKPLKDWHGITTNNNRITQINLQNCQLTGTIPKELSNLTQLTTLDLSANNLTGSIPKELGNLTKLQYLYLHTHNSYSINTNYTKHPTNRSKPFYGYTVTSTQGRNQLTGSIPKELGNLVALKHLRLEGNQLTGPIPATLGDLPELGTLRLYDNQLTGSIPPEIGNAPKLQYLYLHGNQLTGTIPPAIGNLPKIYRLSLNDNKLTSSIPPELGQLTTLRSIHIQNNNITGPIPQQLNTLRLHLTGWNGAGTVYTMGWIADHPAVCRPSTISSSLTKITAPSCPSTAEAPAIPEPPTLTPGTNGTTIRIDWAPPGSNGAQITDYDIQYREALGGAWTDRPHSGAATTNTIPTKPNTTYQTRIRAHNNIGTSDWSPITTQNTTPDDKKALIALYNNTGGPNWKTSCQTNWNTNKPLRNWYGVNTNNDRVTYISLQGCGLTGTLPEEIGDLPQLIFLYLKSHDSSGNHLTSIPKELGGLVNLTHLDLTGNRLTGSIPKELGNLTKLQYLYLHTHNSYSINTNYTKHPTNRSKPFYGYTVTSTQGRNQLTGSIPKELGNLVALKHLRLEGNNLTGPIPATLGDLPELGTLRLYDNQLTGSIPPEIGNAPKLQYLYLHGNQLTGTIPPAIGNLPKIYSLSLNDNKLTSSIPPELGQLTTLRSIHIQNNNITGPIPQQLNTLRLHPTGWNWNGRRTVYTMGWIADHPAVCRPSTISSSLTKITAPSCPSTAEAPAIPEPPTLTPGTNGTTIRIDWAPPGSNGAQITDYDIQYREALGGAWTDRPHSGAATTNTIPTKPNTTYQTRIRAHNNIGTSDWSPITTQNTTPDDKKALIALYNNTGGPNWKTSCQTNWNTNKPLRNWYGVNTNNDRVTYISLQGCGLTGTLPEEIGDLPQLIFLYLKSHDSSGNHLTSIPKELGGLVNLTHLDLTGNRLTGSIPKELGNLTKLQYLYLHTHNSYSINTNYTKHPTNRSKPFYGYTVTSTQGRNQLTGSIPKELGNLVALKHLRLEGNNLTGPIPATLGDLPELGTLRLYDNQLTGSIPPEIGNAPKLQHLYLHGNQLTGTIPPAIGNLPKIYSLSLNDNKLTSSIPPELGQLTTLRSIHIQNNNITGPIPQQLNTLRLHPTGWNWNGRRTVYTMGWIADHPAVCRPSTISSLTKITAPSCPSTAEAPAIPEPPTLTPGTNGTTIRIDWAPPGSNGAQITDYDIQYREALGGAWTDRPHSGAATTNTIPTKPNTTYQTRIRATNSIGTSDWSPITTQNTTPDDKKALIALYNNTGGPNWKTSCQTNWNTNKPLKDWYGVNTNNNGRVTQISLSSSCHLSGAIPAEIGDLTELTRLSLYSSSSSSSVRYLRGALPAEIGNLTKLAYVYLNHNRLRGRIPVGLGDAVALTNLNISGSHQRLTGPIPDSFAGLPKLTSTSHLNLHVWSGADSLCMPPALSSWRLYTPYVTSKGMRVCDARPPEKPDPPIAVPGDQRITLTWTAPTSKDANITDYEIQYKTTTSTTWTAHPHTGGAATTATITNTNTTPITNNTPYHTRVRGGVIINNTTSYGTWSEPSTPVTPNPGAGPPAAPAAPTAIPDTTTNDQIILAWTPPADNGTPITDYDIRYRPYSPGPWCNWTEYPHTGTTTTNTIPNLTNGTTYEFQIRATNNAGTGPWSPTTAATPGQCTYTPPNGLKTKCLQIQGTT